MIAEYRREPFGGVTLIPGASDSSSDDIRSCWACRTTWPRAAMQWRSREHGPRWNPRHLRVLCCPRCVDQHAA
jgi:hypothetical protein